MGRLDDRGAARVAAAPLHHVTVKPSPVHHRGSDVEARLKPIWGV
jgi:hypothetical protein